ncbi:MAG: pyridoxal-phosphate dependent enzyme, partial [Planctomycetota bacterium]|nr:pyridoxal-phosphate dependent enzyme [Planctomycetota bacterium]
LTWPFVRDIVQEVITVSETEIVEAMKLFWTRTKFLIEPSSATAVAAALKTEWLPGREVGVIISGGNVDLDKLPWA